MPNLPSEVLRRAVPWPARRRFAHARRATPRGAVEGRDCLGKRRSGTRFARPRSVGTLLQRGLAHGLVQASGCDSIRSSIVLSVFRPRKVYGQLTRGTKRVAARLIRLGASFAV